jgi:hypothetical protein
MSDGPYKSLNMTPAWKKLAEWAHKAAFEPEEVAGRVVPALEETWRDERCGEVVRAIRSILGDARQTVMFGQDKSVELEAARRDLSGYPMRRLIVDHVVQSVANGKLGIDAVCDGVENALRDRAARAPTSGRTLSAQAEPRSDGDPRQKSHGGRRRECSDCKPCSSFVGPGRWRSTPIRQAAGS